MGALDTQKDLGLNTVPRDRMTVQKVLSCAVLRTDPYITTWGFNDSMDTWLDFNFGYSHKAGYNPEEGDARTSGHVSADRRATFRLRSLAYFHAQQAQSVTIRTAFLGQPLPISTFDPVPAFNRSDADVSLIFLQNRMGYREPVTDPWFNATQPLQSDSPYYASALPWSVGVLGCTEQYRFCNPRESVCSDLLGLNQIRVPEISQKIRLNSQQAALVGHFAHLFPLITLHNLWNIFPPTYLRARSFSGNQEFQAVSLPPDQWKEEVKNWVSTMRIALQHALIDYPSRSRSTGISADSQLTQVKTQSPEHDLCLKQLRSDQDHTSFSVLAIVLIYTIGGLIIIVDFGMPLLHKLRMRTRWKRNPAATDAWVLDDFIHWQQRAFQGAGLGDWTGLHHSVPVTNRKETFPSNMKSQLAEKEGTAWI
ncbi:MAG: hypothetical protein Q9160_005397 [Pyrenula sp. 1 TL-2023]